MSDEDKPKRARPWMEEVTYVECPLCTHCEELGTGVVWGDGDKTTCEKCGGEYTLTTDRTVMP
jgi:hypothetical protein